MQNRAATVAVSDRKTLLPKDTGIVFFNWVNFSDSSDENPPSGPINKDHFLNLFLHYIILYIQKTNS